MTVYEVGQSIVWGLKVYDTAGALADLGGGNPTATVTKPDGTTAAATVAKSSTGVYTASIAATAVGRWLCEWTGSGTNSGGLPYADHADVLDMSRLIVPLGVARAGLNLAAGATTQDDEIRGLVAGATVVVEHLIGPVLAATQTQTLSGAGRRGLLLADLPTAVTSVTEDGTALTEGTDFCWDEAGILWRGSSANAGCWSSTAPRNVVVTYTVGDSVVAPNVIEAAKWLIAHWYRAGQQSWRPPYAGADVDMASMAPVLGYAIPNAVVDLLGASHSRRMPGIA